MRASTWAERPIVREVSTIHGHESKATTVCVRPVGEGRGNGSSLRGDLRAAEGAGGGGEAEQPNPVTL